MNDIAKNIKRLRGKQGLAQDQLAERLHVTRQAVSNWETGKNYPDLPTVEAIAQAFGVEVTELLYGPPDLRGRRRQLIPVAVLWGGIAALALFLPWFTRYALRVQAQTYFSLPVSALRFLFVPLLLLLVGAGICAVVNALVGLPGWLYERRKALLLLGVLAVAALWLPLVVVFGLHCAWEMEARATGVSIHSLEEPLATACRFIGARPWLFLPAGGVLFCGLAPKRG